MFTLEDIQLAAKEISIQIVDTPLIRAYALEEALGIKQRIFLKCENLQVTHSFKARGAFCALNRIKNRERGVVSRSSGNFGIALSFGAKKLKIPCQIVLSSQVSECKRRQMEENGALLHFRPSRDEENVLVEEIKEKTSSVKLCPFDHNDVIMGQSTLGLEVYKELDSIKHFIGPIGGGGLMGGASLALKLLNPDIQTIGVEPSNANDYFLSRKEGKRVKLVCARTICDGLRAPMVGEKNYLLLGKFLDKTELVSDDQVKRAMALVYRTMGIVLEPSGAISVGLLLNNPSLRGDVVCILSGGNISEDQFRGWVEEDERNQSYDKN